MVNFNSKLGCQKCTTIGSYSKKFKRVYFPDSNAVRRTNDDFRAHKYGEHHKERSLLENLDIDMIFSFPSSDPLHLLDLGIMKRCLIRWVFGEKGYARKWSKCSIERVSRLLENCQTYMPTDIHRAIRNLNYLRKWKGVEFRTVLLYVGMAVFEQVLDANEFNHFMTLCCAVRICSSSVYKNYLPIAEKMFKNYVENYGCLYGKHTIGSNVHLLNHIVEDMKANNIHNLMNISTYPFENCLRLLGLNLKHGHLPLEQVSRRLIEKSHLQSSSLLHTQMFTPQIFNPRIHENSKVFDKVKIAPDVILNSKKCADSWFITKTNQIVRMIYAKVEENEIKIIGSALKLHHAAFTLPIDSTRLNIFASNDEMTDELTIYNLNSILSKIMCLPYKDEKIFIPILHTIDSLSLQN